MGSSLLRWPLSDAARRLCRELSGADPLFVASRIEPHVYWPGPCHTNVCRAVRFGGGEQVFGWDIVAAADESGREYGWAEFHSVWRRPDGTLVDITPRPDGERYTVFLPDDRGRRLERLGHGRERTWASRDSREPGRFFFGGEQIATERFEMTQNRAHIALLGMDPDEAD